MGVVASSTCMITRQVWLLIATSPVIVDCTYRISDELFDFVDFHSVFTIRLLSFETALPLCDIFTACGQASTDCCCLFVD